MENDNTDRMAELYERALEAEKSGDADQAATLYRQLLELDESDPAGASIRLAAMNKTQSPDKAPEAYVAMLFNQHAHNFESILVDQLDYCVPLIAHELVKKYHPDTFNRLLDLGCGTGLVADAFFDEANHVTGVDLAPAMIEIASEDEIYDQLYVADIVEYLKTTEDEHWDLIIAADVLPYIGSVRELFCAVARKLVEGGLFVFSTETLPPSGDQAKIGFKVGAKHRFAHEYEYLHEQMIRVGLESVAVKNITVRLEEGIPAPGQLVIAKKMAI